jgi:CubicO group peptidase (beta-lactamase class C family)
MSFCLRGALVAALLAACSAPQGSPDTTPVSFAAPLSFRPQARDAWPTQAWPTATPEEVGLDSAKVEALAAYLLRRSGDEDDRKGIRTNAFVLIKNGKLVREGYARGYNEKTPLLVWSVTKSVANTLAGMAVLDGKLDLNEKAARYYPPFAEKHAEVRVADLLRMSSGIDWAETYETSPFFSSVIAMLYTRGRRDMAAFVAEQGQAYAPGSRWNYSSGDSNALMAVLRGAVGEAAYENYPWERLFTPLGMESAVLERDGAGTFVGSSYLYVSARDLAKWAFLYLNDGVWEGKRILPAGWVAFSLQMAPSYYQTEITDDLLDDNPGAYLYINRGDPTRNIAPPWPEAPADTFAASGHWGKSVFVLPSLDIVLVRLGDDREYACHHEGQTSECVPDPEQAFSKRHMLKLLLEAVKK